MLNGQRFRKRPGDKVPSLEVKELTPKRGTRHDQRPSAEEECTKHSEEETRAKGAGNGTDKMLRHEGLRHKGETSRSS